MSRMFFGLAVLVAMYAGSVVAAPGYSPVGPQTNVAVSTVTGGGWSECYRDTYNISMNSATVLAACTGDQLMLSCRPTGSATLTLLAQGNRADVTFDTGNDLNTLHSANGVGWYYSTAKNSWGFVKDGDAVTKGNCDTNNTGSTDQRLCWHLQGVGGYRCGVTTGLNANAGWERVVYQPGGAASNPAQLTINGTSESTDAANPGGFSVVTNPVRFSFAFPGCNNAELTLAMSAPEIGLSWSYLNSSLQWRPLPESLEQITPFVPTFAYNGVPQELFNGYLPAGSYDIFLVCDTRNGHLDIQNLATGPSLAGMYVHRKIKVQ